MFAMPRSTVAAALSKHKTCTSRDVSLLATQRTSSVYLAFLSACQTSAGNDKLSEEAVHLAAGMLAAEYRGAVATMWSIRDEYGPKFGEDFYSNPTQDSEHLSGEYAACALHHTTQNLRKSLGDSALLTFMGSVCPLWSLNSALPLIKFWEYLYSGVVYNLVKLF
jgi:CHAT domain-containing protein